MRIPLSALTMVVFTAPALAQFPPPGIYTCFAADGSKLGALSLLVAGDYQWRAPDGNSVNGQVASASTSVEALSGPLADKHWKGEFATDGGQVTCK